MELLWCTRISRTLRPKVSVTSRLPRGHVLPLYSRPNFLAEVCPDGEKCTDPPAVFRDANNKIAKSKVTVEAEITVSIEVIHLVIQTYFDG